MEKYDIYVTYALTNRTKGFSSAIHCNYIKSIEVESNDIYNHELLFRFKDNDFKFLNNYNSIKRGFCATQICIIYQIVSKIQSKPKPDAWKYVDVTNQISGHSSTSVNYLEPTDLADKLFRFELKHTNPSYILNNKIGLNYPLKNQSDLLSFGDETFFLGNVTTKIKADVYVLDLSINLPLNEFNSSNNLTWDEISSVYISEVGLYDENKNLVAIGKLNNPIQKDSTVSKTILFAIDF